MGTRNSVNSYGSITKGFHWLIAGLVILMITLGISGQYVTAKPLLGIIVTVHRSTGLIVLCLMVLRLIWRLFNPTPRLPMQLPTWQRIAARASHFLLYFILILMPIDGWIMSTAGGHPVKFFYLFTVPFPFHLAQNKPLATFFWDIHVILAWTISILLSIHILAALKHHFIDRDGVLKRMLPGKSRPTIEF